jgi:hypothetical protein
MEIIMEQQNYMLGIVGFGGMGNWHRETIDSIEGLKVAGIFDIAEERKSYAKEVGVHSYDSLEALLSDDRIDIVLVATPNDLHKPLHQADGAGETCRERGKRFLNQRITGQDRCSHEANSIRYKSLG